MAKTRTGSGSAETMSLWHQSQSVSKAADGSGSAEEYVYTGWPCGDGGGRQGSEPRRTALPSLGSSTLSVSLIFEFIGFQRVIYVWLHLFLRVH